MTTDAEMPKTFFGRIGLTLLAFAVVFFVGLFIIPCMIVRIIADSWRIAWLVSDDVLGPIVKEPDHAE